MDSNMTPAQLLEALVFSTLEFDDALVALNANCSPRDSTLIKCLQDTAKLDRTAARQCILCPIAGTKNSKATTCKGFKREGFCADCLECEQRDCPTACWPEFDEWLECKLETIGCPHMCDAELYLNEMMTIA